MSLNTSILKWNHNQIIMQNHPIPSTPVKVQWSPNKFILTIIKNTKKVKTNKFNKKINTLINSSTKFTSYSMKNTKMNRTEPISFSTLSSYTTFNTFSISPYFKISKRSSSLFFVIDILSFIFMINLECSYIIITRKWLISTKQFKELSGLCSKI